MGSEDINKVIEDHEYRIKRLEECFLGNLKSENSPPQRKKSISEFIVDKRPKDDLQRTVLFAYFLEKHEGREYFNSEEIQGCFTKSKSAKPDNVSDKINQCIKKGWVSEIPEKKDNKKAFYLTNSGLAVIERKFKKEAVKI